MALAYSEFRDYATDFGFSYPSDTPLMLLERFLPDAEHTELAWLTTRVLWGDLQREVDSSHAIASEELSRTLRRRLAAAQPATVRAVAFVSRLSLRSPYAPDLNAQLEGDEPTAGDQPKSSSRRFSKKKGATRVAVAPS